MHGKQLALSFVSPFRSIMQSSQVSCSTNLHHLMAGERNAVGKAPESSLGDRFGLSHPCSDSVVRVLLWESLFLNISVFSHLFFLLPKDKQNKTKKSKKRQIGLFITTFFSGKCAKCFQQIAEHACLAFSHWCQTQTPVHSTAILTPYPCHGKQLCRLC